MENMIALRFFAEARQPQIHVVGDLGGLNPNDYNYGLSRSMPDPRAEQGAPHRRPVYEFTTAE
jgi:hypothetical protein